MTPDTAQALANEWGDRGREYAARRAAAGSPEGAAFAAHLRALPPAKAAVEVRALFALSADVALAADIAGLGLSPKVAELIAAEIRAARRRIAPAARPFRQIAAED
jgi:hypothetical protein